MANAHLFFLYTLTLIYDYKWILNITFTHRRLVAFCCQYLVVASSSLVADIPMITDKEILAILAKKFKLSKIKGAFSLEYIFI